MGKQAAAATVTKKNTIYTVSIRQTRPGMGTQPQQQHGMSRPGGQPSPATTQTAHNGRRRPPQTANIHYLPVGARWTVIKAAGNSRTGRQTSAFSLTR